MEKPTVVKAIIAGAGFAVVLALVFVVLGDASDRRTPVQEVAPAAEAAEAHPSFLYGRVTSTDGQTYEGRLRWGGAEEAFWGDYFNGYKEGNPWGTHVSPELLTVRRPLEIFGIKIAQRERRIDLGRPFMARFGDIVRIEARGDEIRVTLKSGTEFHLDRFAADDLADGLRVWDATRGVVDLHERRIRIIELVSPTPPTRPGAAASRLHGTVRTRQGDFTGFVQWNREEGVGHDVLDGQTAEGPRSLRFDTIGSIERRSLGGSAVTLLDGRKIVLSGTDEVGHGNRGMYVDDRRYGRVLVSWDAFERVDFSPGGNGPTYDDFPPGSALTGSVTTRAGRHLAGRLVYDLDESETTETLDAPYQGVDYTIPFGRIASIDALHATVTLHDGEDLQLESTGDLGEGNAGMLIFVEGGEGPEYVSWADVERVDIVASSNLRD